MIPPGIYTVMHPSRWCNSYIDFHLPFTIVSGCLEVSDYTSVGTSVGKYRVISSCGKIIELWIDEDDAVRVV